MRNLPVGGTSWQIFFTWLRFSPFFPSLAHSVLLVTMSETAPTAFALPSFNLGSESCGTCTGDAHAMLMTSFSRTLSRPRPGLLSLHDGIRHDQCPPPLRQQTLLYSIRVY